MRMRRRRADRCALRAAVALEAGVLDDARAALDEALYLSPDDPALHELAARIEAAERELSVPVPGQRLSRRGLGMAAALVLLSGAGGWLWVQADGADFGRLVAGVDGVAARVAAAIRSIELPEVRLPLSTSNATPPPGSPSQAPAGTTARHEPPVAVAETAIAVPETSGTLSGQTDEAAIVGSPAAAGAATPASPSPAAESADSSAATRDAREVATAGTSPGTAADRGSRETAQSGEPPARASMAAAARGTTAAPPAAAPPAAGTRAETTTPRAPAGSPPADLATAPARESAAPSSTTVPAREPVTPPPGELAGLRNRESVTPPVNALASPRAADPVAPPIAEPASPRPREPAALSPIPPAAAPARTLAAPAATGGSTAAASAEQGVRATLSRYEAAYSGLDAGAASAVWPSVDRRALARAFEDLQNQSVSLSKCDVKVNGASAQADCTGSARWTPKVGSGTQTASRRWRFELRDTGGTWIITQATVR